MRMGLFQKRNCKRTILNCLCGLLALIVVLKVKKYISSGYMPQRPVEQINREFEKYITNYGKSNWKKLNVKKILLWTPFFGAWSWLEDARSALKTCPAKCEVTNDKSELDRSHAVLFHAIDLWKYTGILGTLTHANIEMPASRTPDQVWVLFSMEPMAHMWGKIAPNVFNWTMIHRRDATVHMPFTGWRKKTADSSKRQEKAKPKENFLAEKTKFASTLVSNCYDQGKRYRTIRELQKYVEVDNFGHCTGLTICPVGSDTYDCGMQYLKKYKFYLAFENSYCRDYVSEKFWNALSRNQIPVIAAPDYNLELLPRNSYLNVFDFPSIKDLADRMKQISADEKLFNSFFDWREDWEQDGTSAYCRLCMELHRNRSAQSYRDMEGWIQDDMCHKSTTWSLLTGFIDRTLFDLGLS